MTAKNKALFNETAWRVAIFITQALPVVATFFGVWLAFRTGIGAMEVIIFLAMYLLGAIGIEISLHRYFSHKAFKAGENMSIFLAILGSIPAMGPVSFWALTHREHHQHSDSKKDPHSPLNVYGENTNVFSRILYAHMGWNYHQRAVHDMVRKSATMGFNKQHQLTNDLGPRGELPKLAIVNNYYTLWVIIGILFPALVGWLWSGNGMGFLLGALWGGFIRIWAGQHTVWAVNSLAHTVGLKSFKTRDNSRNSPYFVVALTSLMTILIYLLYSGQDKILYCSVFFLLFLLISIPAVWHNNHHAFPSSATLQLSWWHVDPMWWIIFLWKKIGLVHSVNKPSAEQIRKARICRTNQT
mgnify:CR=1 FL=1|tara:strand:+ start:29265 stop:30329 length:1065 start_codon:yes stop_codon:yes gene_type:complete